MREALCFLVGLVPMNLEVAGIADILVIVVIQQDGRQFAGRKGTGTSQPRQKWTTPSRGMPSVMSVVIFIQSIHIAAGFGGIGRPQLQHRILAYNVRKRCLLAGTTCC